MTEPYYQADRVTLYLGDCIEVQRELPEASVDAIVTDPPYGLEFMGKAWDRADSPAAFQQWCEAWAREAYRVLKPGGHIVAFGGTRTHHRLVCGIEDAGFEIRDELDWMFGSGFPKSLDVSKAIDKAAGAEREIPGRHIAVERGVPIAGNDGRCVTCGKQRGGQAGNCHCDKQGEPITDDAREWQGWGTALKPAHEPICLARKQLVGTVAQNVLAHGTGAINVDGCRIGTEVETWPRSRSYAPGQIQPGGVGRTEATGPMPAGRWPANVVLDEEAAALLDATVGDVSSGGGRRNGDKYGGGYSPPGTDVIGHGDRGGPSRFFYTAKASRSEREAGLDDLPPALRTDGRKAEHHTAHLRTNERRNDHPTVKPVAVMRWLVRLITPPGGVVLDPFLGSGTTGMAALDEGMRFIGIDMTERYVEIARYRVTHRHVIDHEFRPASEALPQGRLL